ncbi:MAG: hypothetical protein HFE39_09750 [Clostridiales bacterium]|jgi:hypothetical protein|nr:hypothetical protein [Clostridiales bacterium]
MGDYMGMVKRVFSFRLEEALIQKLKYYTQKENRHLSNYVETLLKKPYCVKETTGTLSKDKK